MIVFLRIFLILALAISIFYYMTSNHEVSRMYQKLESYGYNPLENLILISIEEQRLYLIRNYQIVETYVISTSKKGIGSKKHSFKTPLGIHIVSNKYGKNAHYGELFEGVKPIGVQTPIFKDSRDIPYDYVTSRVIRLRGLERGLNCGGDLDSYERMILIHGTPEEGLLGVPASRGCIRMANLDIMKLFREVNVGTFVEIIESKYEPPKDEASISGLNYYRQLRSLFNSKSTHTSSTKASM